MLENIVRKVEEGVAPFEAAIEGSREVTGTIISMSISLVAVFLPILLMGGIVGRVLNEFGVVVTLAILSSAVVSLTVTPMLAARLPQQQHGDSPREGIFDRVTASYGRAVGWCLEHRAVVMMVFVATLAATGWMFASLPRSFFPTEDIGILTVSTQARQDISYQAMSALQAQAASIVSADPDVQHVTSTLGAGPGGSALNTGSLLVQLKSRDARRPLDETLKSLRHSLSAVPGLKAFITPSQSLRFGGRSTQSLYQVVLQSIDAAAARQWSQTLGDAMRAEPALFVDVASDLQNNALQAHVMIDNDRASSFGITAEALRTTLEAAFGSFVVTQIQTTGNNYDVILEYDQSLPFNEQTLAAIRVPSSSGALVPLSSFARVTREAGPVTVNQTGQLTAVTLSFNLPQGVSLGTATARIDALKQEIKLPASVSTNYAGAAQIFEQASGNTGLLIGAAVLTIYVVLGVFYESFLHPADDPVRPSICGVRRSADLEDFRLRPVDHRADRSSHADRDRQEERDHDDRRCPVAAARRTSCNAGRHPPGRRAPLSSNHDDDVLRPARSPADRDRNRGKLRAAPTPRRRRRRRSSGQPGADIVHDARRLCRDRAVADVHAVLVDPQAGGSGGVVRLP